VVVVVWVGKIGVAREMVFGAVEGVVAALTVVGVGASADGAAVDAVIEDDVDVVLGAAVVDVSGGAVVVVVSSPAPAGATVVGAPVVVLLLLPHAAATRARTATRTHNRRRDFRMAGSVRDELNGFPSVPDYRAPGRATLMRCR
jgi:hypothetical protein